MGGQDTNDLPLGGVGRELLTVGVEREDLLLVVLVEDNLLVGRLTILLDLGDDLLCGELTSFLQYAHSGQVCFVRDLGHRLDSLFVAIDSLEDFVSRSPTDELGSLLD